MTNYTTKDNHMLYKHAWPVENPKAKVLIVHGLAEHGGRYADLAKDLNKAGYSCVSFDHRGNGRSSGLVAHIESFDQLTSDLALVASKEHEPNVPFILLSHSLGGLICSKYLIDHPDHPFQLAVFSAPAVKPDDSMAPILRKFAGIASALFPKLPAAKLESQYISRDPEVRRKYNSDPLIYRGKVRARKGYEILKAMEYISERFDQIKLPILVMHGQDDKITDPAGTQALFDGAASKDKSIKYYDELYHEIFNEPERDEVIADTVAWMNARVG